MTYTPPPLSAIDFDFLGTYAPPPLAAIDFDMDAEVRGAPIYTPAAAVFDQGYDLKRDTARALLEQSCGWTGVPMSVLEGVYSLSADALMAMEQAYGLKMGAVFSQYYGDGPAIRSAVASYYGDAALVRRRLEQLYEGAMPVMMLLGQPYILPAEVAALVEQVWGISGGGLRGVVEQPWALKGTDAVLKTLAQPFGLLGDPGQVLTYVVAVTAGGQQVDPLHITVEASRDQYCLSAEVHLATQADFLACTVGAALVITINGAAFSFFIESRTRKRDHGAAEYVIRGLSRTARLDAPYASPVTGELSGMASAIVSTLAAGFTVEWRTVDWFIPAATLLPGDQTPLAIIRDIAHAAGAIVQTSPDGRLIIEPDYPRPTTQWETGVPDHLLSDSLDFFSAGESYDHRPGWNRFLVSDQLTSQSTLRLEQTTLSETVKEIRGYKTPWADGFTLRHSGGGWVTIEPLGIESADQVEVVEFVAGEGRTQYPIYGISGLEWLQANLGTVTHAEDGRLVAAVEGESLLALTYQTRCRLWQATNPRNEKVQFIIDEVAI